MKTIKYLFFLTFPLWVSCSIEDEGNYNYSDVNAITIEGIEDSYSCIGGGVENLQISPDIISTINTDDRDYEYSWFICQGNHNHTVIGTEANLNYKVELPAGTYRLFLEIKDNSTGIKWQTNTSLSVVTYYTRGYLLWGEAPDGLARMDMITMAEGKDTILAENVFDNTELKLTKPTAMIFANNAMQSIQKHLFLMTEDRDVLSTSGSYFEYISDFYNAGIIETDFAHTEPMRIRDFFPRENGYYNGMRARSYRGYITDDMIFTGSVILAEFMTTPANRYSSTSTTLFKPYPKAFVRGFSAFRLEPIFYDMTNDCFVRLNGSYSTSSKYCLKLTDAVGDPFPWNNKEVGRTIVYGENGAESFDGYCHAIMKDNNGKYYIYRFQTHSSYSSFYRPTKISSNEVDLSIAQGFDKASLYMISSSKTVVVYAVGSTLWAYDFARKHVCSIDLGQEITCLESAFDDDSASLTAFFVATYDGSTDKGVVKKMDVGGGNNSVALEERPREIWPVTMKVVDIQWKNANDNEFEKPDDEEE